MEAIVERCAGLDVHQATVVACLKVGAAGAKPRKELRTFGTTLPELEELRDWLKTNGCTLVTMESTGVYWMPVYAVLEDHFEMVVGNAHHIKNVPGRKTDIRDCDWISELARRRMRRKLPELERALQGRLEEHHRFLLGVQMRRIETMEADVAELDKRLREKLAPYSKPMRRLMQIPGVDWVIAEIGVDMSVFVNAAHLASWASLCPGNHESAGKQRSGKTRKGNVHLKTALVTAAVAASKAKGTYLADKYRRLKSRRGALRAAVAIGHKILVIAYRMLADDSDYQELGDGYLDQLNTRRNASNMVRRLRQMGYDVQISLKEAA